MTEALQEFVDSQGVTLRVDPEGGVLRGVKLIGLESRNGRRYQPSALVGAQLLYEGAKVNVNHPKEGPLSPRDYQDRLGVIRGVEFREAEGLFGNLHFNPKHPLAEQLIWDAQHNPRNVGVSHNVLARVTREGDANIVEEITHVQSVDLVADPAATLGLYEQDDAQVGWQDICLESLALHRPDLLGKVRTAAEEASSAALEQAQVELARSKRRQRVLELLCEHGLPVPGSTNKQKPRGEPQSVALSDAFFEMLLKQEDEAQLEQLVRERAELVSSQASQSAASRWGLPQSRDQIAIESVAEVPRNLSSADFAKSLKQVSV